MQTSPHFANYLQPFLINDSNVRGRVVRLGDVMDTILQRHDYPEPVSRLLGEALMLSALLAANLKHEGVFTMQAKGDGLVSMLVVDAAHGGELRGYAQLKDDSELGHARILKDCKDGTLHELMGDGYLAITFDPGVGGQRYQGIVELGGETMTQAVEHYFAHSQQLDVAMRLAVARDDVEKGDGRHWRGGGIMLERLPDEAMPGSISDVKEHFSDEKEEWTNAYVLMDTVRREELLDASLPSEQLLYRLYNESGVWVYEPTQVSVGCRCSRERIVEMLGTMSEDDIEEMTVEGTIEITCQFCNKTEVFSEADIGALR